MTRIKGPVLDLAEVHSLITTNAWLLSATARKDLIDHFGSWSAAKRAATWILQELTSTDYDHSLQLPNPPADCDVYGLTTSTANTTPPPPTVDTPWYIKFYEDIEIEPPHDEFLNVISLHHDRPPGLKARRMVVYP
jgi:hypothetical protein